MTRSRVLFLGPLLGLVAGGLVACGGGGSSSALEGVYTVSTWTENPTACDAEGPSTLATQGQTTFYLKVESFFGESFLNLNFCDDLADCRMLANDEETIHLGSYFFVGSDGAGWTSELFNGFTNAENVCEGTYATVTLGSPDAGMLRVERRAQPSAGFPPDADGFCDDEAGAQAAEGQPCEQLEVFTATSIGTF